MPRHGIVPIALQVVAVLILLPVVARAVTYTTTVTSSCPTASQLVPQISLELTINQSTGQAWGVVTYRWNDPDPSTPGYFGLQSTIGGYSGPLTAVTLGSHAGFTWSLPGWISDMCNSQPRVTKYSNTHELLYDSGSCGVMPRPPYCGAPAGWLGETAWVILGDQTKHPRLPWFGFGGYYFAMDMERLAADRAAARYAASGYTVERRGTLDALNLSTATRQDMLDALADPNATAFYFSGHSMLRPTDLPGTGEIYRLRDGVVTGSEIQSLRNLAGARAAREVNLQSCYSGRVGVAANRGIWNARTDAAVIAFFDVSEHPRTLAIESALSCPGQSPAPMRSMAEPASLTTAGDTMGFVPMKLLLDDGSFGDDLYGAIAGVTMRELVNGAGQAMVVTPDGAASMMLAGMTPGDSVSLWINRYRLSPTAIVPPGELTVGAVLVGADRAGTATLVWGYDPTMLDTLGASTGDLRLWRFDEATATHWPVSFVLDTLGQTVAATSSDLGHFTLTVPEAVADVGTRAGSASRNLEVWPVPSFRGVVRVRWRNADGGAEATVVIRDLAGRVVRELAAERRGSGIREVVWDGMASEGRAVPPGVYWARPAGGGRGETAKIIILR